MKSLAVIILAAGKGTRMKSDLVKILHPVAGKPMLGSTLDLARSLGPDRLVVVVGSQRDIVREKFNAKDILFVDQEEQLGTGHAVLTAGPALKDFKGTVLILCADVPLLTAGTVKNLIKSHEEGLNTLSVLTTCLDHPKGYGRVVRGKNGQLLRIVEEKDLNAGEEAIREINTGIYCIDAKFLFPALLGLSDQNAQREYYLTDVVERASSQGERASACLAEDSLEVMGINTRLDLAKANQHLRQKIAERHMLEGVTLIDPQTAYIDREVEIGRDTVIYPNCYLLGKTSLGKNCLVEPGCKITDTRVGNFVTIKASSVVSESLIEDRVEVGPFAHLRPQTVLREGSRIGNFVEVKKSVIGKGAKANHLTYLGDATLGEKVNVGAGTIICNYDGLRKHPTIIEDGVFIGSNTELVAPIKIGRDAIIGAGSTITKEVPPDHLAFSRARQVHYKRRNKRKD
ncbi:MAG: bifunctional UDP-N-acetylglucosamine diphosphorylase/glucosamine-1-phosphate N-acetyltransferase GlmU [Deltaproteobacteria bacterium]|nr:bifunctional UDP-N-acetylglucosamine diphosphorylase/glucosamine-1-phosphate N-acetyltransferase GlmU [Deltaproteobacteria bacterium]